MALTALAILANILLLVWGVFDWRWLVTLLVVALVLDFIWWAHKKSSAVDAPTSGDKTRS